MNATGYTNAKLEKLIFENNYRLDIVGNTTNLMGYEI